MTALDDTTSTARIYRMAIVEEPEPFEPALARPLARALYNLDTEHRRIRESFARSIGLSHSEFNAVMLLGDPGELTPKQLADQLGITSGSATAMIDRLETAGLLARRPHPHDRRSLLLRLTTRGKSAHNTVFKLYLTTITDVIADARTPPIQELIDLLERIAAAISSAETALASAPRPYRQH